MVEISLNKKQRHMWQRTSRQPAFGQQIDMISLCEAIQYDFALRNISIIA